MALDPSIALAYKGIEIPNQLAQYGQLAQIQHAQNQNRLADMQMAEYERARMEEEGARAFLKGKDLTAPETISGLPQFGKTGMGYAEKLTGQRKTNLEIQDKEFDLKKKRLERTFSDFANFDTVADVLGHIKKQLDNGEIDRTQAQQLASQVPQSDADLPKFQISMLRKTLGAKDQLELSKQTTKETDRGGYIERQVYDWQGKPVGEPTKLAKTQTFADQNAAATLAFNKSKFEFEKANPTMSIQEDPSGLLAVNTKTGVATPVVYGPTGFQAAPAAAPGASLMRQPPAALPGQRTPAIPGMTSVLDQTAAPAAPVTMPLPSATGERVPGQPVSGKGKPPPEAYAKQALGVANTNDALEKMQDTMKNFKSSDMLNPTRRAELGQAHATTLLFAKELFNLGVLNGGDERIVNSVINNPVDFSSTAVPIEAIRKQARDLQGVVDRTNKNLSTIYKMPVLKLERSTPSEVANDIHSQAEAILRGTPPRGNP